MSRGRHRLWAWIDTSDPRDAEAFATWRKMVEVLSDSVRAIIMREIIVSGLEGVAQKMGAAQGLMAWRGFLWATCRLIPQPLTRRGRIAALTLGVSDARTLKAASLVSRR